METMFTVSLGQRPHVVVDVMNAFTTLPIEIEVQPDREVVKLLADLSPDTPWGARQRAAKQLGYRRDPEALPGLLAALPADPFWMVRCAIIQALERIGDPGAIPTLREVARRDGFQVVRSYAAKAVERLSREG
jgi:HEAT repeat protein